MLAVGNLTICVPLPGRLRGLVGAEVKYLAALPGTTMRRFRRGGRGAPCLPITVVVPIHNASAELERCLDSVVRHTHGPARLLLIDDASTESVIAAVLARYGQLSNVEVLTNEENLGFTRTVNRGLEHAKGDVVLLNSDAEVGPGWLQRLLWTAASDVRIGTVTAISNNAGAFSVPKVGVANEMPPGLEPDDVARLVAQASAGLRPQTPTGNGFCMYMKRAMLDDTGLFDADQFPRGYGEENDLSMRARDRGWRHVVDDSTFVVHARAASFGTEKDELAPSGRAQVSELHPEYEALVRRFVRSPGMRRVRQRVEEAFAAGIRPRPRLLVLVHEGEDGTAATTCELLEALRDRYEPYILRSNTRALELGRLGESGLEAVARWRLRRPWRPTDFSRKDYREIAHEVLDRYAIELVHVHHLVEHTFDLPRIAAELDIPLVVSLHDFYLSCPTVHLLDDRGEYCEGVCTAGAGVCRLPSSVFDRLPPLKHRWVHEWRAQVAQTLAGASAVVTSSEHAREVYVRSLPSLRRKRFEVISPGRKPSQLRDVAAPPSRSGPVRIAVPGALDVHEGAALIGALGVHDVAGRLEFRFLDNLPDECVRLGPSHGTYARDELGEQLRRIRPSFVAAFSIWGETYCHTMTEAWAAGVPVLATDIGTLRERILEHGGGWLLPHDDPARAYARILEIIDDPQEYEREAAKATLHGIRTLDEMAQEYDVLYRSVLEGERSFVSRETDTRGPAKRAGITRVAAIVPGSGGRYPGSSHVRVLRRLDHPVIRKAVAATVIDGEEWRSLAASADLALVQRTALPPDAVGSFVEKLLRRGVPLVVELDDDLFLRGREDTEYGPHLDGLARLLDASSLATVSTELLRDAILGRAANVVVVPNAVDERLWLPPVSKGRAGPGTRLLYVGTKTHADDLALLRPVIERLRREVGLNIELSVVGGEPERSGQWWYSRLGVPRGASDYPAFVTWLKTLAGRFDVAVAPLVDNEFNRSKSDLKFLEYSGLGLPGVYSDVPAYASCVEGVTALKTPNTVEGWCEALTRLGTDADLRASIAEAAGDYVFTERCLGHGAAEYADLLARVVLERGS